MFRPKTDGFWLRLAKPDYDPNIEYNVKSMSRLGNGETGTPVKYCLFDGHILE